MICTKCRKSVRVISKFLDDRLNDALEVAGEITNEVAKCINNPLFQLLVSQLPTGTDAAKVLAVIENVLTTASNVAACKDLTGIEKVNCLMNGLNLLPKDERNSVLLRLKSALTAYLDGNRYEKYVYDTAGQFDYFNRKVNEGANLLTETKETAFEEIKPESEQPLASVTSAALNLAENAPSHAMPVSSVPQATPPTPQAFSTAPAVSSGPGSEVKPHEGGPTVPPPAPKAF